MPRNKQNQKFKQLPIADILAGRVDNAAFFDIDEVPVDRPVIAQAFEPTSFDQMLNGERPQRVPGNLLEEPDIISQDGISPRFPLPEQVPLPRRNPLSTQLIPTIQQIERELRKRQLLLDQQVAEREQQDLAPTEEQMFLRERANRPISDRRDLLPVELPSEASTDLVSLDELPDLPDALARQVREDARANRRPVIENSGGLRPTPEISALRAGAIGLGQGLSGNTADEVQATGEALLAMMAGDERPFLEIFAEKVAPIRQRIAEANRQQPVATTIGELGGFIAGPGKVLKAVRLGSRMAPTLGRAGSLLAEGAGVGTFMGAAGADGREPLLTAAAKGAFVGAPLNLVGATLGNAIEKGILRRAAGRAAGQADGRRAVPKRLKNLAGTAGGRIGGALGGPASARAGQQLGRDLVQGAVTSVRQGARAAEGHLGRLGMEPNIGEAVRFGLTNPVTSNFVTRRVFGDPETTN